MMTHTYQTWSQSRDQEADPPEPPRSESLAETLARYSVIPRSSLPEPSFQSFSTNHNERLASTPIGPQHHCSRESQPPHLPNDPEEATIEQDIALELLAERLSSPNRPPFPDPYRLGEQGPPAPDPPGSPPDGPPDGDPPDSDDNGLDDIDPERAMRWMFAQLSQAVNLLARNTTTGCPAIPPPDPPSRTQVHQ